MIPIMTNVGLIFVSQFRNVGGVQYCYGYPHPRKGTFTGPTKVSTEYSWVSM
jgi:hypothetical protein